MTIRKESRTMSKQNKITLPTIFLKDINREDFDSDSAFEIRIHQRDIPHDLRNEILEKKEFKKLTYFCVGNTIDHQFVKQDESGKWVSSEETTDRVQIIKCTPGEFVRKNTGRKQTLIREHNRITIPKFVRDAWLLAPRDDVVFENDEDGNLFYYKA